jgi:2-polyprenyl-3-methyl-5-hydroxy-6-metoxy-1,4-benzoquinol methylase
LEHLPDPIQGIKSCYNALKINGIFIIEVPQELLNDLDVLKNILGMKKKGSFNPYSLHHTYFFSPAILSKALQQHGFEIIQLKTANLNYTPLKPFQLKNFLLRPFLYLADRLHHGGSIIEIFARKVGKE